MARALHNVIANAKNHGHPEAEPIELRVELDAAKVSIIVRDRGPGFAPEMIPRAFEPFVSRRRGTKSRRRHRPRPRVGEPARRGASRPKRSRAHAQPPRPK